MSIYQITELTAHLSDDFKNATPTIGWSLIKGMRNQFAHVYYNMDAEIIWETATNDLPVLKNFCEQMLA